MSVLYQRARNSGLCPPSLLSEQCSAMDGSDGFDVALYKVIDPAGFFLQPQAEIAKDFEVVLKKVENTDKIVGTVDPELKKQTLRYRRCIVLAVVGGTPIEAPSLARLVVNGYLDSVKLWLDEILSMPEGSVDLLLHLLSSVTNLPVNKAAVQDSGMGKAIGIVGKHAMCKGTPNESAIKDRVQQIKDAWHASVKARKPLDTTKETVKRVAQEQPSISPAKRHKTDVEQKKSSSFTNLLKKVSGSPNGVVSVSAEKSPNFTVPEKLVKSIDASTSSLSKVVENSIGVSACHPNGKHEKQVNKKPGLRVKWADHFGGQIAVSQVVESEDVEKSTVIEAQVSWSDRKLRDRMHEKELLAKAKKSKLLDDEDVDLPTPMQSAAPWKAPFLLPERPTVVQPQLNSSEVASQQSRILSVSPSRYTSDFDVPLSPDPLSDVEQALDMTSQASAVIIPIPFFAPQLTIPETSTETFVEAVAEEPTFPAVISPPVQDSAASIEVVQSLGLPLFLIGQPVRALQTLAGSPSLLSTLVDANGLYDQTKLLNLIQTLTSSGGLSQPASSQYQPTANSIYGTQYGASPYGELTHVPSQTIRTVVRKSDEGNLHVSGYGPGVTESDLIATFSPYVHVDEVVLKGTFAFVNTSDPVNAQRAREALTGTHLNGMPLRINNATRKVRDNTNPFAAALPPTNVSSYVPPTQSTYAPQTPAVVQPIAPGMTHPAFGAIHPNIDSVRDDRGNPATKNLFVAGYGPGTTEQMLRDVVGQYSVVTGVVSKGTFAFVNTSDRHGAVVAREYLSGTTFNGGVLRINFAKETGRLGTSFDLTYGPNTGPNSTGSRVRPADMAYYGQS